MVNMSDLDSGGSDADDLEIVGHKSAASKKKKRGRPVREEEEPVEVGPRTYTRSDCFKVEKNLLVYGSVTITVIIIYYVKNAKRSTLLCILYHNPER